MNSNNYNPYFEEPVNTLENEACAITEFKKERKDFLITIACYLTVFYVVASVLQIILLAVFASIYEVDISSVLSDSPAYYDMLTWSNFLTYVVCLGPVLLLTLKYIIKDFKTAFKDVKGTLLLILMGIGIMYAASIIATVIVELLTLNLDASGSSENQEVIEALISSSPTNALLMVITTVLLAPVLEEIIFRKCLFGVFKNKTLLTIAISAIVFAGIHVVPACIGIALDILMQGGSTLTDLYIEAIYIISYLGQAIAMSYIYHRSNHNIVPSIIIHIFNNVVATLAILLM